MSAADSAMLYACLLAVATVAALALRSGLLGADDDHTDAFGPALQPIEVAYLAGGAVSAMESAVASVRYRVAPEVEEPRHRRDSLRDVLTCDVLPVERAVYALAAKYGGAVEAARREAEPVLAPVRSRLTWLKLFASEQSVRRVRRLQVLLFGALLALGVAWGVADAPGQSPNYLLLVLCAATAWIMTYVRPASPCRTRRGDRMLDHLRAKNIGLLWRLKEQPHRLPVKDLALAVALFGEEVRGQDYVVTFTSVGDRRPSGSDAGEP